VTPPRGVATAAAARTADGPVRIALVGSPNAGKTTLFNALTGAAARVGNYPGVTVERRCGPLRGARRPVSILDLPGTYALEGETPDEQIVERVLAGTIPGEPVPDALLVVADATTLRRGLGLVHEVLEHGLPALLVLTMVDEVKARGGRINLQALSRLLGVHVVGVVGHRGVGIEQLKGFLEHPEAWPRRSPARATPMPAERFAWVDAVCRDVGVGTLRRDVRTDRIDPIDGGMRAIGRLSHAGLPAGWLTDLWADGVVAGVGSVLIFLPQILILFTALHLLNDIGYMARAAFVVDRVMGWVGLQGRSFVPLLSCYACAVPGIMAARTIASPRERLATILVAPFMTCSARLPVYTLLIAAFVPAMRIVGPLGLQGLTMFGLYLLGAATALGSAALLNSTLLRGRISVFYMELPPYRWPTARLLTRQVWRSAAAFLRRAGTIILATSVVLWVLLNVPRAPYDAARTPQAQAQADLNASTAARLGRALEPAIAPLGFDWRIGIGLVASLAAREVIVSTLAQIYAVGEADDFAGLRTAIKNDVDPRTGRAAFTLPVALSLLVFFVFALQCTSTMVVMARETGSWRWPALAFAYMLGLAWIASFVTFQTVRFLLT
jgi:ferrous iron transport protein B